jgi:hypothetical protein
VLKQSQVFIPAGYVLAMVPESKAFTSTDQEIKPIVQKSTKHLLVEKLKQDSNIKKVVPAGINTWDCFNTCGLSEPVEARVIGHGASIGSNFLS